VKPDAFLTFLLAAASRRLARPLAEAVEGRGLTVPQFFLLAALWERDGVKAGDLAGRVRLDAATVTGLLDRLEKGGLAERRPDAEDRRALRIHLTAKGRRMRSELAPRLSAFNRRLAADLASRFPPEELEAFLRVLTALAAEEGGESGDGEGGKKTASK
jgi:DNA-binding MarR family transcriptional regulator